MEQRRLRLGDILDDYCPRERRVTNHAVVAMIEERVQQTRCTTCDAEHAYKGARVPTRRKKETPAALYKEVLAGMPEVDEAAALAAGVVPAVAVAAALPAVAVPAAAVPALVPADVIASSSLATEAVSEDALRASIDDAAAPAEAAAARVAGDDDTAELEVVDGDAPVDGPVHRPLIRAQLPRVEGQKEARPVPDFTVRHTATRGNGNNNHGGFRGDRDRMRMRSGGNGNGHGNGNGFGHSNGNRGNGGARFQSNRPAGGGRPPMGRAGGPPSGLRGNGNGNGNGNKRGRGSRG